MEHILAGRYLPMNQNVYMAYSFDWGMETEGRHKQ